MEKFVSKESGRLDKVMSNELSLNRSKVQKIIEKGVNVNGKPAKKAGVAVEEGDVVEYEPYVEEKTDFVPTDIPIDVVYEDEDILVINKPRGLVVHPAAGHHDDTLANALAFRFQNAEMNEDEDFRMGIVHRIDKGTSGLLVVAKNAESKAFLQEQISHHLVKREYAAIAHGYFDHPKFKVDAPIGRDVYDRKKMAVDTEHGKEAITHFEVQEQFRSCALLKCTLETGRTHQIRVHLAYIGHPIVGDPLYGTKEDAKYEGEQLLHAYRLTLTHPRTHQKMSFEAPFDGYFTKYLEKFRNE